MFLLQLELLEYIAKNQVKFSETIFSGNRRLLGGPDIPDQNGNYPGSLLLKNRSLEYLRILLTYTASRDDLIFNNKYPGGNNLISLLVNNIDFDQLE